MQPTRPRSRDKPKDARAKLSPEERAKVKPPPVEREAFEKVMRGLLATPPKKR